MQGNTLNLNTPLTSGVGFKGQILILCRCQYIFFNLLSTNIYLTGVCYDLNMGFMFCDLHVSLKLPSEDINSSKLSCWNSH